MSQFTQLEKVEPQENFCRKGMHKRCINDFDELFGFEHFKSNAKTNVQNSFILNARCLIFKPRCSNTKPAIESLLHSMRIIKSSEYVIAKHTGALEKHYLKWTCV